MAVEIVYPFEKIDCLRRYYAQRLEVEVRLKAGPPATLCVAMRAGSLTSE